jgi:hypothetical protein
MMLTINQVAMLVALAKGPLKQFSLGTSGSLVRRGLARVKLTKTDRRLEITAAGRKELKAPPAPKSKKAA